MKIIKIIIPLVFFLLGIGLSYLTQGKNNQVKLVKDEETLEPSSIPAGISNSSWVENEEPLYQAGSDGTSDSKLTIFEKANIISDKTKAQTGEEVKFSVTLVNKGNARKFITHLCFNHSGGVTFGCVLNINLDPGQELPISGSTVFVNPGTYSVFVTWSQDKTNFYRPQKGSTVWVSIQ